MSTNKIGKDLENLKKGDEKEKNTRIVKTSKSTTKNVKEEKTSSKFSNDPVELLFN